LLCWHIVELPVAVAAAARYSCRVDAYEGVVLSAWWPPIEGKMKLGKLDKLGVGCSEAAAAAAAAE